MNREIEDRIAALAARQHGVVTRAQLLDLGLRRAAVRRRGYRRLHRGVYLVGPILPPRAPEMAAVLACGPSAVVSHRSAAALWGLMVAERPVSPVEVLVTGNRGVRRAGILARSVASLAPAERAEIERVPVTSPSRTVVDLASVVRLGQLEGALARGEREGLVRRAELEAMLAHMPRRSGAPRLRALLIGGGVAFIRSEAEARFLDLMRRARLPPPEVNVLLEGYEVDFLWRRHKVAVEVDGYSYHSSRPHFERDRRRAAHLAAQGIQVIPLSWQQIVEDGVATAVQLGRALLHAELSWR